MLVLCSCLLLPTALAADKLTVVYPEVKSAYARVFDDIAKGIKQGFKGKVKEIVISKGDNGAGIEQKINKQSPDALIALSGSSLRIIKSLQPDVPVLAGAVVKNGYKVSGISMIPQGSSLMAIMLALTPNVKAVYVINSPKSPAGLVESAEIFLHNKGIELIVFEASSLRQGASAYQNIIAHVRDGDAVWILPGAPHLDSSVFALLLEEAWKKQLTVFSSNPSHVRRGTLFAVYPDNEGMGRSLGIMANKAIKAPPGDGLIAVEDLYVGVNDRTAKHLGISLQTIDMPSTNKMVLTH